MYLLRASLLAALALLAGATSHAADPATILVSVASDGTRGNGHSNSSAVSADGRYVAFESRASNFVRGDINEVADIFVRDTVTGTTTRVSTARNGSQANEASASPSISADGRYVAFQSYATNLVPGDTNNSPDIFLRDTVAGTTTRVSVATDGTQGNWQSYSPSVSSDGRYVAFESNSNNLALNDLGGRYDVFVRDTVAGKTTLVSVASDGTQGDGQSYSSSISSDGRYVAFYSSASNLVSGDTNGKLDAFIHDTVAGTTTRVSVGAGGVQGNDDCYLPHISADGRYAAFYSYASNLVKGDTNGKADVFVRDILLGTTARVSAASSGAQGNGDSKEAAISADGRYVTFSSSASGLVVGDTNGAWDVFVRDTVARTTKRISITASGMQGDSESRYPSISADGKFVAFETWATQLVPSDTNSSSDIVVYGPLSPTPSQPNIHAESTPSAP